MLNEFVEKIVVHERDRKGSIETTQEVEIYFNFIGKYLPPHFGEVEMTPEEIEEMKKREARKDRLHQNYLKRKAKVTFSIILIALIVLCQGKLLGNFEYTLIATIIVLSLALALGIFLSEYLLYRYDHDDHADESEE